MNSPFASLGGCTCSITNCNNNSVLSDKNGTSKFRILQVCLWNVNGLARHLQLLQDRDTHSVFTYADIFGPTETRMVEKEIYIDGFDCVQFPSCLLYRT